MKTKQQLLESIEFHKANSAWNKGVKDYAYELVESVIVDDTFVFYGSPYDAKLLLNGASNWSDYSFGGCALIYDSEIAERLCTPTELKRNKNGYRNPNQSESWLEVQERALIQAQRLIMRLIKN
jgi:hypothetical protein